jgi:general secretion pathway protein D
MRTNRFTRIRAAASIAMAVLVALGAPSTAQETVSEISAVDGRITANLKNIQVGEVLKLLADKSTYNFVISDGIKGTVTLYVRDMDAIQLLDVLCELANIGYEQTGNTIKVYNAQRYQQIYSKEVVDKRISRTIQLQNADIQAISKSIQPLKSAKGAFILDSSSNSIIVTDLPERITEIERVVAALDVPPHAQTFKLQYVGAEKMATTIKPYLSATAMVQVNSASNEIIITDNQVVLSRVAQMIPSFDVPHEYVTDVFHLRYPSNANLVNMIQAEITPDAGSVVFDEATNSLIVKAIPEEMARIRGIVDQLDRETVTVLIEAKIVQIALSDDFKMGVNWQYITAKVESLSVTGVFNVLAAGDRGITVMSGNLTDSNYHVLIEALKTTGKTNLLSSPRIMAINGESARIHVGETVPYKTVDTREEQGTIRTFEKVITVPVGVMLSVTPYVNEDGWILMDIKQEVSSVKGFIEGVPAISTTESETTVGVDNGTTVVMAGLIKDESIKIEHKVPILGSIPLIGLLFRSSEYQHIKSEIIIFLTPHITSGEATEDDLEKLDKFKTWRQR